MQVISIISRALLLLCMYCSNPVMAEQTTSVTIHAEQWDMPRHGETLIRQPQLRQIVSAWMQHPETRIEIRYPGGEEGELWVRELMDWLIALGVPSASMGSIPGSGAEDVIHLELVPLPHSGG